MRTILFLNPVFKQMVWGGNQLGDKFGYAIPGDDTGECWGVSAHPNGKSIVREGLFKDKTLSQLWRENPELFGNIDLQYFPLLTKIIDAKGDCSVQVHPGDEYAREHENGSLGKTECWYIIDCEEDAAIVLGHNARSKEELTSMIEQKKWNDLIREVIVKPGDFIQVDSGMVHAIRGGMMVLETQQNSDITYRVYDYGRKIDGKERELHIKQSIDVITVPAPSVEESVKSTVHMPKNRMNELISCHSYVVWKLDITEKLTFEQSHPFMIMSVIEGEGEIDGHKIKKGDHFILPDGYGHVDLQGDMVIIASSVK